MAKLYPGLSYQLDKNGKLTTYRSIDESAVRQQMGRATVLAQAKRFGWSVQEQKDGKLLIQKGRL